MTGKIDNMKKKKNTAHFYPPKPRTLLRWNNGLCTGQRVDELEGEKNG